MCVCANGNDGSNVRVTADGGACAQASIGGGRWPRAYREAAGLPALDRAGVHTSRSRRSGQKLPERDQHTAEVLPLVVPSVPPLEYIFRMHLVNNFHFVRRTPSKS